MAISRPNPRVSINQIAGYLVGTPTQRRRILRDAKNPPTFMVNWYDPARQCINEFVAAGMANEAILTNEISRLYAVVPTSDHEETRLRTNAEALESVLGSYDQLDFAGLTPALAPNDQPYLGVCGVEISVRPEFFLSGSYRNRATVGGLKLYISKEDRLTDISAPYITCVVMRHVQANCTAGGAVARQGSCLVYDVFAGRVYAAPSAVTRRFQDIDAACQEITLVWPTV